MTRGIFHLSKPVNPTLDFFVLISDFILLSNPYPLLSSPIKRVLSLIYLCGGTTRLIGAGEPLYTRPAKSNLEP
jgi:hypothetical protein